MTGRFHAKYLYPEQRLARVFDHTLGYGPYSWNPRRLPLTTQNPRPGRFDILITDTDPGGYLYGTEADDGEAVAIVETLRSLLLRDPLLDDQNTLKFDERNKRTIQYFAVSDVLTLIDIHEQEWRESFHMDEEVQYSGDRSCTRQWSDFLKRSVPNAAGIAYNSTQTTADLGQSSFVLWESRVSPVVFRPLGQVPLNSPQGWKMVDDALMPYDVLMVK
jgi:hypothetical protein